MSMECGEYPDCLKISQTVPIPKCSSPSIPSHYRPVSILPTGSKIYEKIVYARVSTYLNKINFLQTFNTDLETLYQLN